MSRPTPDVVGLGALASLAPELAETFVSIASDIALVIDPDGVIRNVAQGAAPLMRSADAWVGKAFVDTVTNETRGKIQQLLTEVGQQGVSRKREVNLPGAEGLDIPVAFAAIRLGEHGPVLAVGRDLRAIAAIQQRFIDAQQELEREYWQQRQAEARYRLLFQVATDAVMVVDAATLKLIEANRAASHLLGITPDRLVGLGACECIDAVSRSAVEQLLATARSSGRPSELRARLNSRPDMAVDISATPFRATVDGAGALLLLVRVRTAEPQAQEPNRLADLVERTPDAVVITDSSGRVQMANPAFVLMCPHATNEQQVRGRLLTEVLGDPSHRLADLVGEVRDQGIASQVRISVGPAASPLDVEISATLLDEGDQVCLGFTLRRQDAADPIGLRPIDDLVSAVEMLSDQLGRVSLPELVQEFSYVAERHLMRVALARSQGQAAAAADWLGITPESLALRVQRHGLTMAVRPPADSSSSLLN
ncbi:MAG: transcriptional regulator PpsR [Pseudomonadota bacterium]